LTPGGIQRGLGREKMRKKRGVSPSREMGKKLVGEKNFKLSGKSQEEVA